MVSLLIENSNPLEIARISRSAIKRALIEYFQHSRIECREQTGITQFPQRTRLTRSESAPKIRGRHSQGVHWKSK